MKVYDVTVMRLDGTVLAEFATQYSEEVDIGRTATVWTTLDGWQYVVPTERTITRMIPREGT